MSAVDGLGVGATGPTMGSAGVKAEDPAKIAEAAKQFEALLVSQLLKSMRDSGGSWLGTEGEGDQAAASTVEIAEEQFAAALSSQGGLGLARLVAGGLKPQSVPPTEKLDSSQKLKE